jgi:hypothetical protein
MKKITYIKSEKKENWEELINFIKFKKKGISLQKLLQIMCESIKK